MTWTPKPGDAGYSGRIGVASREQRPFDEPVAAEPGDHRGDAVDQGRPARRHRGYACAQSVDAEKQRHDEGDDAIRWNGRGRKADEGRKKVVLARETNQCRMVTQQPSRGAA